MVSKKDPRHDLAAADLPLTPPLTPSHTSITSSESRGSHSYSFDAAPDLDFRLTVDSELSFYASEPSMLPSPISPTLPPSLELEADLLRQSRFLFVSGVPLYVTSHDLEQAFAVCGTVKDIFVSCHPDHSTIVLAFYDVRHAVRVHCQITTRSIFPGVRLQACFVSAKALHLLTRNRSFVTANDGRLRIATSPTGRSGELTVPALQDVLKSFGELRAFHVVDTHAKAYCVEFFDIRDAASALDALNGHVLRRERLILAPELASSQTNTVPFPTSAPSPPYRISDESFEPPAFPAGPPHRPPAVPSLTSALAQPPPARCVSFDSAPPPSTTPVRPRTRRKSNIYHFDSVGKAQKVLCTPPRPRSLSVASEGAGLGMVSSEHVVDLKHFLESVYAAPTPQPPLHFATAAQADALLEHNRIDFGRIERGEDTRTTVMIKNIPNRMSDSHLIEFIHAVSPRKIDFLYLRMDFVNDCNVGYAFVNFIRVKDLLHFARTKCGTKWNLFSSEKVLGMTYANYQGKHALIDKFRGSPIMDQREAWRPKLFYSTGPKKGLPEDFPAKDRRRKELAAGDLQDEPALFYGP